MAVAGSLTYDTEIDKSGFKDGLSSLESGVQSTGSSIKNIVTALGIDKLVSSAFNLLSSSVDSAISRLDTLNNYPKVMANLGFSTEDAETSMSKLSDSIEGLPTSLDEIVSNTQQMALSLGDLDYATDVTVALNDALLTYGASSEDVTNDITQLNQMISAGTFDQQSWNSVVQSAPGLMDTVAQSILGASASQSDLRTALNDGTVSTEDFLQAFVTLDQEGSGSVTAFSQSAKDATGGIGTAITNLHTRVTKGMADIIQSLSDSLENAGFGSLEDIISGLGTKIKEVLDSFSEKIPTIINVLQKLAPVIVTVTSAIVAFKTALAVKSAIDNVKKSMHALNLVLGANPIAIVIALIVALVAGFIYLWNNCEGFRNFWIGLWEKIKSVFETVWNAISTFFTETIPNAFQNLKDKILQAINSIISFFTETIPNAFTTFVTETVPNFINSIITFFQELPGKIWTFLTNIITNIGTWITNMKTKASTGISTVISNIVNYFKNLPGKIWTFLVNVVSKIGTWITNMKNKVKTGIKSVVEKVTDGFKNLPTKIQNIGKNIVQGLWNGINNAKDWLTGKIKSFCSSALDGIKSFFGINSPSTVMRDEVGKFIPQGVGVGIEADTDSALKAIDDMNNSIMDEMNKAVYAETGAINADASIKSNNSSMNTLNVNLSSPDIYLDKSKVGRAITPQVSRNIRYGGAY